MYEVLEIEGGNKLQGTLRVSGAKNAALPLIVASLLSAEECVFENVPALEDVDLVLHLLEQFGAETSSVNGRVTVRCQALRATEASYTLVKAVRASFWVLGPLLARGRAARVALPGGDIIGARPVDMHLAALVQMGADITVKNGVVYATAIRGLHPAHVQLRFPSVGATHQVVMAAALTPGVTVIEGAAREPEVVQLCEMLQLMGARIEGIGTSCVAVHGVEELGGARVRLIGDRVEAGTYLLAAAVTGGEITVQGVNPAHLEALLELLRLQGLVIDVGSEFIVVRSNGSFGPLQVITQPFPGFPTDLQAPLMAQLCYATGRSTIEETIFEGRFGHVAELCRMGAQLQVSDRACTIFGGSPLSGAQVEARDIRSGAALVVAALGARGVTQISEVHHLRRGYENIAGKLRAVGAQISFCDQEGADSMFSGC